MNLLLQRPYVYHQQEKDESGERVRNHLHICVSLRDNTVAELIEISEPSEYVDECKDPKTRRRRVFMIEIKDELGRLNIRPTHFKIIVEENNRYEYEDGFIIQVNDQTSYKQELILGNPPTSKGDYDDGDGFPGLPQP